MKKIRFRNPFLSTLILSCCTLAVSMAQTPAPDLDSITEDSYRRMLERQEAERISDSVLTSQSDPVLTPTESKKVEGWYYPIGVLAIVVLPLILWYYQRISRIKDTLEK